MFLLLENSLKNGLKSSNSKNGAEAIEKLWEFKPDLILMDLQMPVMNGYEITSKIREFDKETPIVARTASATLETKGKTIEAGMNDYISKPFNPSKLYRTIKKYVIKS